MDNRRKGERNKKSSRLFHPLHLLGCTHTKFEWQNQNGILNNNMLQKFLSIAVKVRENIENLNVCFVRNKDNVMGTPYTRD